jgi:deaminated glutathione amidase
MRIAIGQMAATTDTVVNLRAVAGVIQGASEQGAELVVLPEAAMCSFAKSRIEAAEPFDGPWASAVREMAELAGVTVVVGMFTTTGSERVRNTLLVTGAVEARYDKLHVFDALGYAESRQIEPGNRAVTFQLGGHTVGLATCYDVRFPGLFTHLAGLGAEMILLPSSWAPGPEKLHQWRTLVTARAMDSTTFVVAVDQALPDASSEGRPTGIGHSLVVGPTGTVILELGDGSEYAVVDLDLDAVAEVREQLPVLEHTRDLPYYPEN